MRWALLSVSLDMQFRPISNKFDEPRKGRKSAIVQTDSMISEIIALKEAKAAKGVAELVIELSGALSGCFEMLVSQMRFTTQECPRSWCKTPWRVRVNAYLISVV